MIAHALAVLFVVASETEACGSSTWCGGAIVPGSIKRGVESHVAIRDVITGARRDVRYPGELPDTLCDGVALYAEGLTIGDTFVALRVWPINLGKYDACFAWRCIADERRPPECREVPFR